MSLFALVDCNNFYVSCERVFNPKLANRAVVVLSNNDGCVVARSNEAKLLGVKMGEPYFKMRARLKNSDIIALSSNYSLYADLSDRVMQILTAACPNIEYYSIDEAFLCLADYQAIGIENFTHALRQQVKQYVGIPISIGVASTKVLAKVANHIAKKHLPNGVCVLSDPQAMQWWLEQFAVQDLWGIGARWAKKLNQRGIVTAWQLSQADPHVIKTHFNIMLARIIYELRGTSCLQLEKIQPKKSIICSRSFGKPVTRYEEIAEALSIYTARACEKLRSQKNIAASAMIFLRTNPHNKNQLQRQVSLQCYFANSTADTIYITDVAKHALKKLFKPGYYYQKVGIMLFDFSQDQQGNLWNDIAEKRAKLMATIDHINHSYGRDTIFTAACGTTRHWQTRTKHLSQQFTTRWSELLSVD